MATYASHDDVLARAGRFAGVFQVADRRPNIEDLDGFLDTVSAAIDAAVRAHGYDPTLLTDELVEMLRDVAAWAVLIRALPSASPGDNAVDALVERGRAIVTASGFRTLADAQGGNIFTAIGALETLEAGAGGGGAGTSAGSFWDELPDDWATGRLGRRGDVTLVNGALPDDDLDGLAAAPQWRRGQSL